MTVKDVYRDHAASITKTATVADALQTMQHKHSNGLLVLDGPTRLVGIIAIVLRICEAIW